MGAKRITIVVTKKPFFEVVRSQYSLTFRILQMKLDSSLQLAILINSFQLTKILQ
jgi:hypothetical protein